ASAVSAGWERPFAASISAAILDPRPEIRTATRFFAMRSPLEIEASAIGGGTRVRGRAEQRLDRLHHALPGIDIDAGLGIGEAFLCHGVSFVCSRPSVLGNPRLCNGLIAAILILAWPHVRRPMVTARRAGRAGAQI